MSIEGWTRCRRKTRWGACSRRSRPGERSRDGYRGPRIGWRRTQVLATWPSDFERLRIQFSDRPYFDGSLARRGDLRGYLDRVVQVWRLDQVKARQMLLGLGERTVGDQHLAVPHAHRRR